MKTKTLKTSKVPSVLPTNYLGKRILKEEASSLLEGKRGKRDQVNGLVYHRSQLPTNEIDNGWNCVIRSPSCSSLRSRKLQRQMIHKIKTDEGYIFVEYLKVELNSSIKEAVDYFITNHNETRNIDGESGVMRMAGNRIDLPLSSMLDYAPSLGENKTHSRFHLDNGAVSFHNLLLGTICAESLINEIKELSFNGKFLILLIVQLILMFN